MSNNQHVMVNSMFVILVLAEDHMYASSAREETPNKTLLANLALCSYSIFWRGA